jgi:CHAT domain
MAAPDVFRLEVEPFQDPTRWRWVLRDPAGGFVEDHPVALDPECLEYQAMTGLQFATRWHGRADPERPLASEAEFLERVGRWMGEQIFGKVGDVLVDLAPVTANVVAPAEARMLLHQPFELAWVGSKPLALQNVSLVFDIGEPPRWRPTKQPIGERLRMLAVFSLPAQEPLLILRQQRYELARSLERVAATRQKAIHLVTLQYGVTRDRLREVLEEGEGWDVLHFSGHGLATELVLETERGGRDPVRTDDLLDLLRLARTRLKLLVLSACDSGAAAANETVKVREAARSEGGDDPGPPAPIAGLAVEAARRLDCAVLGMRYLVGDDFSISLTDHLYDSLLGYGNALPRAMQLALPKAVAARPEPGNPPLSVATPALFGARAVDLRLDPPQAPVADFDVRRLKMHGFDPEPEQFVGRVEPMTTASMVLATDSGYSGLLFHGPGRVGKTACALELAYRYEDRYPALAWHKAPTDPSNIAGSLVKLSDDMQDQLPGFSMAGALDSWAALERFLPRLSELMEQKALLLVIDGIETLLTAEGRWKDDWWGSVITALLDHSRLSRLVLSSRRLPAELPTRLLAIPVPPLAPIEALLLARQLPQLGDLLRGRTDASIGQVVPVLAEMLAATRGIPELVVEADRQFAASAGLDGLPGKIAALAREGGHETVAAGSGEEYLELLQEWTRGVGRP